MAIAQFERCRIHINKCGFFAEETGCSPVFERATIEVKCVKVTKKRCFNELFSMFRGLKLIE